MRSGVFGVWAERAYQRLLPEVSHLPEHLRRAWIYYGLFPSAVVQACPGCRRLLPGASHGPRFVPAPDFSRGAARRPAGDESVARYLSERIIRNVIHEDLSLCRFTNEGVKSESLHRGASLGARVRGGHLSRRDSRSNPGGRGPRSAPLPGRVATLNAQLKAGGAQGLADESGRATFSSLQVSTCPSQTAWGSSNAQSLKHRPGRRSYPPKFDER